MSRTEAKRRFTLSDQINATEGVECRKDANVIDEIPMAYKDIDAVVIMSSPLGRGRASDGPADAADGIGRRRALHGVIDVAARVDKRASDRALPAGAGTF